jgi:porin
MNIKSLDFRNLVLLAGVSLIAAPAAAQSGSAGVGPASDAPTRAAENPPTNPQPPLTDDHGQPFAKWWDWKTDLKNKGVDFTLAYRSEDLAAVAGAHDHRLVHAGQIALVTKFDMDKLVDWEGASITASVAYRDGNNVNNNLNVPALFGPQEIFGRGHYFRLTQFWLDQALLGGKIELRLGRLSPGEDFQATECSFVNLSFCANQAGNFVSDYWFTWPISQWGAVSKFNIDATHYIKIGAYQVNPRQNLKGDLLATLNPRHGTGVEIPIELGWFPTFRDGRVGEYRIGAWYSTANRKDVYLDLSGRPAGLTGLPFRDHDGTWGADFSIVQQITRGDRSNVKSGLRAILKGSIADKQTSVVDRTIAGTLVYTGTFPGRAADDVGVALAFNHLNGRASDYRSDRRAAGFSDALPGSTERTIEAYYSLRFGKSLMFRPDVQWIHRAGGSAFAPEEVISGMRTEISF